ncbi:MAG: HAMP domain-containing histidine kinase [Deltaproteobacteria bacterium]|nr:HAMP domain-containing histidine kinase [Deltaproteobacteria bacterium]
MSARTSDPTSRRLRNFVLLVIFAVAAPSLLLTGFGLIAINNERDAALKRINELYSPTLRKLTAAIDARMAELASQSENLLAKLTGFANYEIPFPTEEINAFLQKNPSATNFFVIAKDGRQQLPRPKPPLPSWQGYLPDGFNAGRQLEFASNRPGQAVDSYRQVLASLSSSDPARCPVQNALARALKKSGQPAKSAQALAELVASCGNYVDSSGYNLAIGAHLQWLHILHSTDRARFVKEAENLAARLGNPGLVASQPQIRFAAKKAVELIQSFNPPGLDELAARFMTTFSQADLLAALAGLTEKTPAQPVLSTVRVSGTRQVVVLRGGDSLSGFQLDPASMQPFLESTLEKLEMASNVRARIQASANPETKNKLTGIIAGSVFLKKTDLAWRLDLILTDSASIDQLTESRTRMYFWVLLFVVAALVLGILRTMQVMYRETKLSKLKTDFVSSVSHELRTPLTSIRMFTETLLLERVKTKEEERECLETIGKETERLSRLVERILDFSRMEAGRKAFRFKAEDLCELVQLALAACRPLIEAKSFDVTISIAEDLPNILVDRDAIVEVLINLLSNAIKYSPENRRVEIWARQTPESIEFGVSDQGIGILRSDQKKIFEKFYRVDMPLASEIPGSGLGLSLVEFIVRAHAGEILVDSTPDRGSTFTVRLPKKSIQPDPGPQHEEHLA